jgi:aspartyl-tRNA(Asn)/glutamyl-tRNA(Gln) amidotransferase subunit C
MPLTLLDVRRIAHLARLEIATAEEQAMLSQLNGFFGIVEQMNAVDTAGVEPLYTPLGAMHDIHLRLRDDEVTEIDRRAACLANAPAVESDLFLVPKVIE